MPHLPHIPHQPHLLHPCTYYTYITTYHYYLFILQFILMEGLKKYYRIIALPLFSDNYSYIISGTLKNALILVDPANPAVVMNYVTTNFPKHIVSHVLYTHKHWDHAGGSEQLAQQLKEINPEVKIIIGEEDKSFVVGANYALSNNQELSIGQGRVKTVHVPCHTRGHTIFSFLPLEQSCLEDYPEMGETTMEGKKISRFDSHSCTFTGDTLFVGGIGRFFEGTAKQMSSNIENMYNAIDLDSDVFCGHEYSLQNLEWGTAVEPENQVIQELRTQLLKQQAEHGLPCSIPSSLRREKEMNVFVRAVMGSPLHELIEKSPAVLMNILREMKNNNITDYKQFIKDHP